MVVYRVKTPSGVVADGEWVRREDIPAKIPDRFGCYFETAEYVFETHSLYACGICACYHPWDWNGDCREDANRYGSPEEYAEAHGIRADAASLIVYSWEERVAADGGEPYEADSAVPRP